MGHRVIMVQPALRAAPKTVRDEARERFEEIAEGLQGIPVDSPFWISTKDSVLQIDVKKWRVVYRVDPIHRDVVVVELDRLRG